MQIKRTLSVIFVSVLAFVLHASPLDSGVAINYKITINPSDLSGFNIEMHIPDARGTIRLAMAAHPEYDDRYFRYVENFLAESGGRKLSVTKAEERSGRSMVSVESCDSVSRQPGRQKSGNGGKPGSRS